MTSGDFDDPDDRDDHDNHDDPDDPEGPDQAPAGSREPQDPGIGLKFWSRDVWK